MLRLTSAAGVSFTAKPPNATARIGSYEHGEWGGSEGKSHFGALCFDLDSQPARFFFDHANSRFALRYEVDSVGYWYAKSAIETLVRVLLSGLTSGAYPTTEHDKAKFTFTATGSGVWTLDFQRSFGLSYKLPSKFESHVEAEQPSIWQKIFTGKTGELLKGMTDLKASVPSVLVDLGSIDLFLTTNLLFPGQKALKLKAVDEGLYLIFLRTFYC